MGGVRNRKSDIPEGSSSSALHAIHLTSLNAAPNSVSRACCMLVSVLGAGSATMNEKDFMRLYHHFFSFLLNFLSF